MSMSAAGDDDLFAGYRPPGWPFWNTEASDCTPPVDPLVKECFDEMAQFYLDAARRLPIADIPHLASCLSERGLAIGLCDPVTNILLTTIYAFALDKEDFPGLILQASKEEALKQTNDKLTFVNAIHRSRLGLINFMLCYFRYLSYDEAKQCLTMAGHNLPLAVILVEKACGSSLSHPDPDSATTKVALEKASYSAWCSAPKNLVHLMTSKYEPSVVDTIKQVLCYSTQLSKQRVIQICDLLRQPFSRPPPLPMLTPRTFRDSNGQVTTTFVIDTHLFPSPAVLQDGASMAIITSSTRTSHGGTVPLSTSLTKATRDIVYDRSWRQQITTWFLRMSLLDTMHELYIKALAQLPMHALHRFHLIRAVLTAGHTYGPMAHPVANIMFNSIWYDALFPFCQVDTQAADILDPRCMSRVESRSLDAIVALICKSDRVQMRDALVKLCKDRRDLKLWSQDFRLVQRNIDALLQAAKHPQPDAYAAFIKGLTMDVVGVMRDLMMMDEVISDDAVHQLKDMITKIAAARGIAAWVHAPALSESTLERLSPMRSAFKTQQDYVRGKLEILLGDYSLREGQKYHVGLICGVASQIYYNSIQCYHVNFLANMDIVVPNAATPTPMHKLFFAEFWNQVDQRIEESTKPPICCVVQDYRKHFGRCNVCESTSSTLVHPPSCGYFMAIEGTVFPSAERLRESDLESDQGMLDIDFIYFDAAKNDFEFAVMREKSKATQVRPCGI